MYLIVWKYEVSPTQDENFKSAYGPTGEWATLFSRGSGYIGTELIAVGRSAYITIDRWQSSEAFDDFFVENKADYDAIDEACSGLTVDEALIGRGVVAAI